jgi:hypothetical protein
VRRRVRGAILRSRDPQAMARQILHWQVRKPVLTEWLQLMLGEIARKRDEQERALAEDVQREREQHRPDNAAGAMAETPVEASKKPTPQSRG